MANAYRHQMSKNQLMAKVEAGELQKPSLNRKNLSKQLAEMGNQDLNLIRHGLYEFDDKTKASDLSQSELWKMGTTR